MTESTFLVAAPVGRRFGSWRRPAGTFRLTISTQLAAVVAGVAGAIYFVSQGDYAQAVAVLGLGGGASASAHVLHQVGPSKP